MRVAVVGSAGQLGYDLLAAFSDQPTVALTHENFELEDPSAVEAMLARERPDLVINTAAFHDVERCEEEPERAFAVNAFAVDRLAARCARAGARLVHVSTDYVFDGERQQPYREDDAARPLSAYGVSKYAGERLAARHGGALYLVRTSGLYGLRGSRSKGSSFVERILAQAEEGTPIRVVTDVVTSPSCTVDVARGIRALVDGAPPGTYHVANGGACSWYEFACAALRLAGFAEARVEPTTAAAFPSKVRRPPYSALAGEGLARAGIAPLADWQSALAGYFAQRSLARAVR